MSLAYIMLAEVIFSFGTNSGQDQPALIMIFTFRYLFFSITTQINNKWLCPKQNFRYLADLGLKVIEKDNMQRKNKGQPPSLIFLFIKNLILDRFFSKVFGCHISF